MSELSEIKDYLKNIDSRTHEMDKKIDTHIAKTEVYRETQSKENSDYKKTLYQRPEGLVYQVEILNEKEKQNSKHKTWMATLFGVPIFGWLVQAAFEFLTKK